VIDSGSKDNTIPILKSYKDNIKLLQIPNSEFSHGATRSKAAHIAKGEFILFLTQDATPKDEHWLANMIEPFYLSPRVGCVFGKQVARPSVAATIKREVTTSFGGTGGSDSLVIYRSKSLISNKETNLPNTFFSDVNSAVRRELLIERVPFRDVRYAEDQALAEDMQNNGYIKVYAPRGEVWHSNEYTAKEYFHRKFDEYIGLQETSIINIRASKRSLFLGWIKPTYSDWIFILKDREYSKWSKFVWLVESPFYNIANKAGMYFALRDFSIISARKKYSLEQRKRS
jgi:rhamnosyltransferase